MKLLVVEYQARSRYISREAYWTARVLHHELGWRVLETEELARSREPLADLCHRRFGEPPRAILFWEGFPQVVRRRRELARLDAAVTIVCDDLHWFDEATRRTKRIAFESAGRVLATYGYAFDRYYPELAGRVEVHWMPHAASPDFLLPFGRTVDNTVLVSGKISRHYPLRQALARMAEAGTPGIVVHDHPGYHCRYDHARDERAGPGYARLMRRHRAAFTDTLTLGYLVAKHFEIPAVGSLLLAEESAESLLAAQGLEPERHYLPVREETLGERVDWVRDPANHPEIDEIRRRARKLVHARHTTAHRAAEIDRLAGV